MHWCKAVRSFSTLVVMLTFTACFGGGSSGGTDDKAERTGRFIDSPVAGLSYQIEDAAPAVTNERGEFSYHAGDTLSFRLGVIELGSALGAEIVTLRSLQTSTDGNGRLSNATINKGRLLLTLDSDGDPANGLQISQQTRDLMVSPELQQLAHIDFQVAPEDFLAQAVIATADGDAESDFEELLQLASGEGRDHKLADAVEAAEHIQCSEQDISNGAEPDGSCVTGLKPEISVTDVAVNEAAGDAVIRVIRSGNTRESFSLRFVTVDGSANGADYQTTAGDLLFGPGQTEQSLSIPIADDNDSETAEVFQLQFGSQNDVDFVRDYANITILDDDSDAPPQYSLNVGFTAANRTVSVAEGDRGASPLHLTIQRSGNSTTGYLDVPFSVSFSTEPLSGATPVGESPAGEGDYYTVTDRMVQFAAGEMEKVVTLRVRGDLIKDPDEQFAVRLTRSESADNVTVNVNGDPVIVEIVDDEPIDEPLDTDGDGIPNSEDTDDDNDGTPDINDAFPLDANEDTDTDGDNIGNNSDTDDDNDGVPDVDDAFPLDPNEDTDTDGDGTGNNADTDDDGDNVLDVNDECPNTPLTAVAFANGCSPAQNAAKNTLKAGAAEGPLPIPVGTPLGGYLRPPVGGEYIPTLEDFGGGDPMPFFNELLDFVPTHQDHDGVPIASVPDELRAAHSPYANISPPTHGYFDSLLTKAVALENEGEFIVLVKMEFIGMIDEFVVDVGAVVKERTNIDLGDGLIMSGTHTHDGPGALLNHSMRALWVAMDIFQPELYDRVINSVADVVIQALENRQPARFGYANGIDGANGEGQSNRYRRTRSLYTPERVAKQDELRRRIGVLRLDQINPATGAVEKPLAAVVNYSAHGIAFGVENLYFSGDVMGAVEREMEQQFDQPVVVMSVQGAGGDISPSIDRTQALQGLEKFGKKLAPQIYNVWESVDNWNTRPTLKAFSKRIILNQETLGYSQDEYPYPWGAFQCGSIEQRPDACLAMPAPDANDLADNGVAENQAWGPGDTRLAAAQIGDMVLLAQPGEALTEFGVRLLDDMESKHGFDRDDVYIWGTSQDHIGYLLPAIKEDWAAGGTEGTTTFWGWKLGTRLREVYDELATALAGGDAPVNEFEANYTKWPVTPAPVTPSLRPARVIQQPEDIQRFEQTQFSWEGGDPVIDLPNIVLEVFDNNQWQPAKRPNGAPVSGFYEMHLEYQLATTAHQWIVTFEAPKDWPVGDYRVAVSGQALQAGVEAYTVTSDPFSVSPATNLRIEAEPQGDTTVATVSYLPQPENYRVIDPQSRVTELQPVRNASVAFSNDTPLTVFDDSASISQQGQRIVSRYQADITDVDLIVAVDAWGNTGRLELGEQPPEPPAEDDHEHGGAMTALAHLIGNGVDTLSGLYDDPAATPAQIQNAVETLLADIQAAGMDDPDASLQTWFENIAAVLGEGDPEKAFVELLRNGGNSVGSVDEPVHEILPQPPLPVEHQANSEWQHYVGALHEHSGYSDGAPHTQPRDYFAAGIAKGLDFVGGAEHSDNEHLPATVNTDCASVMLADCLISDDDRAVDSMRKWAATLEQARSSSSETFTGFRGFEWTSDRFGHISVYFSRNTINAKAGLGYGVSMEPFWQWFSRRPELQGGSDGLGVFNHPGREDQLHQFLPDSAYAFNDLELVPSAVDRMVGIEVFGKGSRYEGCDPAVCPSASWYAHALDKGWKVGAVGSEDHHSIRWGDGDLPKTVLIARDRSEGSLREAMLNRRMYAVAQHHNHLRFDFRINGETMGSELGGLLGSTMPVQVVVNAGQQDVAAIQLVSNGNTLIAHTAGNTFSGVITVAADERWYFVRLLDANGQPIGYSSPIWVRAGGAYADRGEWIAGDFHVHSSYGHDSYTPHGPNVSEDDEQISADEFYSLGMTVTQQFAYAASRGLDFLAITDHNDVRSQSDPGFGAFGLIPIRSYENSRDGHLQMHGARKVYEDDADDPRDCGNDGDKSSPEAIAKLNQCLREDGGVVQYNHPADGVTDWPSGADWPHIRDGSYEGDPVPDAVEIVNVNYAWKPPFPSASENAFAVQYWEGWLDQGERVAATGGSDSHYLWLAPLQGAGQPTTWVYVEERSERGVLEALKAGRSYVSYLPPGMQGAFVELTADADGDGVFEAQVGDEVPRNAQLQVKVQNLPVGGFVRLITNGGEVASEIPVVGPDFVTTVELTNSDITWVHAEIFVQDGQPVRTPLAPVCDGIGSTACRNPIGVLGITSAIYLTEPVASPPPPPEPTPEFPAACTEPGDARSCLEAFALAFDAAGGDQLCDPALGSGYCVSDAIREAAYRAPAVPPNTPNGEFTVQRQDLLLTVDGEPATGLLYTPNNANGDFVPTQLLTFSHGHGEQAADFDYVLSALAERTGAVIVAMDYRNAPGNGDGDYNLWRGYRDTTAATEWALAQFPSIETSDIWGWSMGGWMSGLSVAYRPELYRHWIASFPGVNAWGAWALFGGLEQVIADFDDQQELENETGCSFVDCPNEYFKRTPSLLASRMEPERAIILHSLFDSVSPYQQGREMHAALVANGVPTSFYSFFSEPNGAGQPGPVGHGHNTAVARESVDVVERILAGVEPSAAQHFEYAIDETVPFRVGPIAVNPLPAGLTTLPASCRQADEVADCVQQLAILLDDAGASEACFGDQCLTDGLRLAASGLSPVTQALLDACRAVDGVDPAICLVLGVDPDTVDEAQASGTDYTPWVDPRIGSYPPGFTNPGAAVPHGIVGVGPDTEGPVNYGGYSVQNALITGLSHIHMSAGVYQGGQFPILPISGDLQTFGDLSQAGWTNPVPDYSSPFDRAGEIAEAGYYKATLLRYGVTAEVTASERVAMHRYRWLQPDQAAIVFDLSRDLKGFHPAQLNVREGGVLTGHIDTTSPDHRVYFALELSQPYQLETDSGTSLLAGDELSGSDLRLVLKPQLPGSEVLLKLALSYVDAEGALANLAAEMPSWDFAGQRLLAKQKWQAALAKIETSGGTADERRAFYTALYRLQKFPNLLSDVDGRYRMEEVVRHSERPRYTQFSLWDSYRGQNQMLAEISPAIYRDMVASMVEYADVAGNLPRWQLATRNPGYMSGDPAVMFVSEGLCRGLLPAGEARAAFDAALATARLRNDEIALGYKPTPQPKGLPNDTEFQAPEFIEGGGRNAGTTLEFGLADFALAAMADALGENTLRDERLSLSLNYQNLLDSGDTGWIRPRDEAGNWIEPFFPEIGYGFQEGTSWQYSWLTMHDYAGLISGMGGSELVNQRLDTFFGFPVGAAPYAWPTIQNQITAFGLVYYGNQYAPGNEHDLEAPYVYNYSGQPWRTQAVARAAASIFTGTAAGLPGNDDLGALSGWLVWTMLGAYPINPGLPLYTFSSPVFEYAKINRPQGPIEITAPNASATNRFIETVSVDGVSSDKSWMVIPRQSTRLSFGMSPVPNLMAPLSAPPSISTAELAVFGCTTTAP